MAQIVGWADVLACFSDRVAKEAVIHRLSKEWADRFGIEYKPVGISSAVHHQTWNHIQVGEHLDRLAIIVPALITTDKPRRLDGPLVLIDFGNGNIGQIDGRRRANQWRNIPGNYDVLTLCAY